VKVSFQIFMTLLFSLLIDSILVFLGFSESRPFLFLLVLIYWNLALPEKVSLISIIIFGFLYDLFQGTLLGVYSIGLLSVTYIFQRFFYQFRTISILQQCILVFLISLSFKLYLGFDFEGVSGSSSTLIDSEYIRSSSLHAISNSLIWPLIYFALRSYRRSQITYRR